MIKLIVGLGNPGEEYDFTRHNVGKLVVEAFPENDTVIISENNGFMNESGRSVVHLINQHNISPYELCIVHDDLAFEVGDYRLQKGKNANGHNGIENIIHQLGTNDFWRLRVGIGAVPVGVDQSEYVLGRMSMINSKAILKEVPWMWEEIVKIGS